MLDLDPPSDVIDATEELWSFFAAHPGPGLTGQLVDLSMSACFAMVGP